MAVLKAQDARAESREEQEEKGEERGWLSTIFDFTIDHVAPVVVGQTEQADTRGWILLPSDIWVARIPVEPGEYDLTVRPEDSAGTPCSPVQLGRVAVRNGETVFRSCRVFGGPHPIRCD